MIDYLRELNFVSVALRLLLSAVIGFSLGMERGRKRRPAGCRTYMLVCMGATLTLLLSQYEYYMLTNRWYDLALEIGIRTDVSRFGAQVINGVGFLGAGTILVTGRREVKGLTTAAGLWASACMGLAIGAGFYESVVLGTVLIFLSMRFLPTIENMMWSGLHSSISTSNLSRWTILAPVLAASRSRILRSWMWRLTTAEEKGPAIPAPYFLCGCPGISRTRMCWFPCPDWTAFTRSRSFEEGESELCCLGLTACGM